MSEEAQAPAEESQEKAETFSYSDDYREVVEQSQWKSNDDIIKSYVDLRKDYSSGLRLPDELGEEHLSQIYTKLGKPENIDGYTFDPREDVEMDNGLIDSFKQFAHQKNMPKELFQDLVNFQIDAAVAQSDAMNKAAEGAKQEAAEALKGEWKDGYDTNFKQSKETAEKLGILEDLEGLGLADHPNTIKMLHKISAQLSEDTLVPKTTASSVKPEDEIKELTKSDAMLNPLHPDHKQTLARFHELCRQEKR